MISKLKNHKELLILSVIVLLAVVRFINLDADPGIFKRVGDIHDEGYWASNARNLVLYNQLITDEANLGAATAPLYTFFTFLFFKLFSVSNYTLRLTSAVFGILTILLAYLFLKKYNKDVALWGTLFLALNYQYFTFNRIGHVEVFQSFFILLTFFLLERKYWFMGGLSCSLIVSAKFSGLFVLPSILLYFIFKSIRKEAGLYQVVKFILGNLVILAFLFSYEFYFRDLFQATHQHVADSRIPSVINLTITWFAELTSSYTMAYLINPINVLLFLCFIMYLRQINFLDILSKNFVRYVASLDALDVIMISWFFGYTGALFITGDFGSERRMNLVSVMLSFMPAILLFGKNKINYSHLELGRFKFFVSLIPLVFVGKELARYLLPLKSNVFINMMRSLILQHRQPIHNSYLQDNVLIGIAIPFLLITILTFLHRKLSLNTKKSLRETSIISLILVMALPSIYYLTTLLGTNDAIILIILLVFVTCVLIYYLIVMNANFIKLIYAISLSLILITLLTPQFSIRDVSLKLAQFTSEKDYIIGFKGHILSYNARYHPVWWWPLVDDLNDEYVKHIKPAYLLVRTKEYGKENSEWPISNEEALKIFGEWPLSRDKVLKMFGTPDFEKAYTFEQVLEHIRATGLEKVDSFGLFPVFGRYGEEYDIYKILYRVSH